MKIRSIQANDEQSLIQLIAEFRMSLAGLRGKTHKMNLAAAKQELSEYLSKGFPIYVAEHAAILIGYLVCRVDGDVVWAESLYVIPGERQRGVGTALYAEAERLAQELGGDTPYNWVDPNNVTMIHFLQKRGYNVLNLIELRRTHPKEKLKQKISVGPHEFDIS